MYQSRIAICCFTIAALTAAAEAQVPTPAQLSHPGPAARAAQTSPGTITIDGRLDEAVWATAEPVTSFTQFDPKEGEPATQRTDVRILIDGEAIYFGARMFESDPAKLRPRLARRDEAVDGDVIGITLDSRHDHLSGYYFRVTAGGAVRDAVATQGGDDVSLDLTWDAVWESKTSIDPEGWIAEIRIPLSQIPYNRVRDPVWGIQIERFRWNDFEQTFFAFTPRREVRGLQTYGHLTGLGELPAPSRVELLPYVT
ncbi:MAG TPA: carbohydrate binding family 9 domain-containing protein, partial [Gemmatimonadaceae bacterium]|nr:carbohydrate binding family 9 domain-containing protein [Gemmatimonadaceae bacterium]